MTGIGSSYSSNSTLTAITSGQAAIAAATQGLSADAQALANPDAQNPTAPLMSATQSNLLNSAGAEVIQTSNEMLGTLLDVFA
jgi:tetrahydromethanopterin S-methyltransferase subunit E